MRPTRGDCWRCPWGLRALTHRQPIGSLLSWGSAAASFSLWEFGGTPGAEVLEAEPPQTPLPCRPPAGTNLLAVEAWHAVPAVLAWHALGTRWCEA